MNKMKLQVGQALWYVPDRHGDQQEVKVTAIGRKWASLDNGWRANKETLALDGGDYSPNASLWHSEAEYKTRMLVDESLRQLRTQIAYSRSDEITLEDIAQVRALMRLPPWK